MHRFYVESANFSQPTIKITDRDEIHHIKDVLRLKKGDKVQVFNGASQEADVIIERLGEDALVVKVGAVRQKPVGGVRIILACAPPKKGKFELIIEKATELGVSEIVPLQTKRTEVIFPQERMKGKLGRFDAVAVNAAKQSKRVDVPKIHPMMSLGDVLKQLDSNGIHVIPSLNGHSTHLRDVLLKADRSKLITIFIGPEGDFTPDEVAQAVKHGCVPVSLGKSVLKVETAAITTVALARFLLSD